MVFHYRISTYAVILTAYRTGSNRQAVDRRAQAMGGHPHLSQSKGGGQRLNLLLTLCRRNPDAAAPSDNGHSGRVGFQRRDPGPACGITGLSKLSRPGRL